MSTEPSLERIQQAARDRGCILSEILETMAEVINKVIASHYGSDFEWDEHVGRNWRSLEEKPKTVFPKETYLLMILWDMRDESNDVLHYLSFAKEEDIKELLELEPVSTENNSGVES